MNQVFEYFERKNIKTLQMFHNSFLFLENKEKNFTLVCSTNFQGKNYTYCNFCGTPETESSIVLEFTYHKPQQIEILHTHMDRNENVIDVILNNHTIPGVDNLYPVILDKKEINSYLCKAILKTPNLPKLLAKEDLNKFMFAYNVFCLDKNYVMLRA